MIVEISALIASITLFALAIFLGFELITKVPPTLHTPLMSGANAVSGISVVGALFLSNVAFKGGADTFLHKGTNERWKGVLTDEDLAQYRAVIDASVPSDLAAWLEHGRLALEGDAAVAGGGAASIAAERGAA